MVTFMGYWANVRVHIVERMTISPCLESLIIKRRRFNQNNSSRSCANRGRATKWALAHKIGNYR